MAYYIEVWFIYPLWRPVQQIYFVWKIPLVESDRTVRYGIRYVKQILGSAGGRSSQMSMVGNKVSEFHYMVDMSGWIYYPH